MTEYDKTLAYFTLYRPEIGTHISKSCTTIYDSIVNGYKEGNFQMPVQMFLHNPQSGKNLCVLDLDMDIIKSNQYIQEHNINYYTHSPYIINLSNPYNKKSVQTKEVEPWCLRVLREDLQLTDAIGGKGVVVHVGKSTDKAESVALDVMYQSIQTVLPYATKECPLLLETPAHQGTELCWTYDSLKAFYDRFTDEEKQRFKICVDTCHVFASGYDPLEYLKRWDVKDIGLIHLNDSKCPKGARKDRHALIGTGYIGAEALSPLIDYCINHHLNMVLE